MDGYSKITIAIPADRITLTGIRRRIEQTFNVHDRINWKYVWSSYTLMFDNRFLLVSNANKDLRSIGITDGAVLRFKKLNRRRKKGNGPIRLRENERDQYILV